MRDAQKPDHVSLNTLIGWLREGRFVIPNFQREFEWKPSDIRELVRSIFLDYYIGSLLVWRGKPANFAALACEPLYGFQGKQDRLHIVLDGQQRLTAMHYVFLAPDVPMPNRANRFLYFIRVDRFMTEDYDDAFEYDWTRRGVNLIASQEAQYESHAFPLSVVGKGGWELPNWVQGYERHWADRATTAKEADDSQAEKEALQHAEDARRFGEHLKGITEQYQVAYIELDRDLEIDKVCDIFTQINSRGIRLDVFDLFNALLTPRGLQLKAMWREAASRLDFVESERLNVYLLQVMSILRQGYCSPKYLYYLLPGQEKKVRQADGSLRKQILVADAQDFEERWHQAVTALEQAIKLLRHPQEYGAIASRYLPYVSILPVFSALQETVTALPGPRRLDAQRKLRHWYWASVFTNRYSGSVESTAARDFLDVKAWFQDDTLRPPLIGEFHARFRSLDLRREVKRGTSVYNGIFNLLLLNGARDWSKGTVAQVGDLDDHHVVPKAWGKAHGLVSAVDTILNRTPLTVDTNRNVIRERLPNEYLPEWIASSGESAVRAALESSFISAAAFDILMRAPFTPDDFEAFLVERQRTIRDAIEDLLVKERLDLPPRLRELDSRVEQAELSLREIVVDGLGGEPSLLPPHIRVKIEARLQGATKRNPAMDLDHYTTLAGMLEFADLRELEGIIVNKARWPAFQDRFGSKEPLAQRFGQLAGIRNGLRHSRKVDCPSPPYHPGSAPVHPADRSQLLRGITGSHGGMNAPPAA